jgi:BirA family transcriptional regulator, biotin operon repressor / biotin---[acetyl-CoA-carboxylase] ligase
VFGVPHRHFRITDSTNTRARELAAGGAPGGAVVTADEQTAGRGRQGRAWTAPPGKALLYSAVLRPFDERHFLAPLAVPLAVCETAEALRPEIECRIKWPNDVWVDGRKLAGILIETRAQEQWAVIGIGLNLSIEPEEFSPELRETATSLGGSATSAWARDTLDERLSHWLVEEPARVLAAWRQRDALRGREVAWEGGSGVADGVDDRGCLVVVSPGGDRTVLSAGDVHLRL